MNYKIEHLNGEIPIETNSIEVVGINVRIKTEKSSFILSLSDLDKFTDNKDLKDKVLTALSEQFGIE